MAVPTSDGAVAEAGGSLLFRPMLTQQVGNFGVAASSIAVSRSGRATEPVAEAGDSPAYCIDAWARV